MSRESITSKDLLMPIRLFTGLIFRQDVAALCYNSDLNPVKRQIIILKATKHLEAAFAA